MLYHNTEIKKYCNGLVLFTSESCNLQCSYCDMANHVNKQKHAIEAKKVKESMINGQYLNTIQKSLKRLEINPEQITHLSLWGQEPTLTIKEFGVMFPELYKYCFNINDMLYSTNGVGFIQEGINFIKVLKDTVTQPFVFNTQFSFDGEFVTEQNRGIHPQHILDNIKTYITELNKIDLGEYITINLGFHNVINRDIIRYYSNENKKDELFDFLNNFSDLYNLFLNLNKNDKVILRPFSCAVEVPFNASVDDGKKIVQFYKNCESVGEGIEYKIVYKSFPASFLDKINIEREPKILPFLTQLNNQKHLQNIDKNILNELSRELNCGFNHACLKIRYDGTLVHCQNALLGLSEEELKGQDDANHMIQKRKLFHGWYPNTLTSSDEELDNYFYQCNLQHSESFPIGFASTCNLLALLLHAKQVDQKYHNPKLFLRCAYYLTLSTTCIHNAMMCTGSTGGKYAGWIRLLCNGFMDIIWDHLNEEAGGQIKCYL